MSTTKIWKAVVIEKPDSSSTSSVDVISPLYISSSGPEKRINFLSGEVKCFYQLFEAEMSLKVHQRNRQTRQRRRASQQRTKYFHRYYVPHFWTL